MIRLTIKQVELMPNGETIRVLANVPALKGNPSVPRDDSGDPSLSTSTHEAGVSPNTEGFYFFHVHALEDRRRGYGLNSHDEAIDALLREHVYRISRAHEHGPTLEPEGDTRQHHMGGVHSEIVVAHAGEGKKQRERVLQAVAPRLPSTDGGNTAWAG